MATEKIFPRIPDDKLTRIPVRLVYFLEQESFAGVSSSSNYGSVSKLECGQPKEEHLQRFVLCSFLPAWQMFEISFHDKAAVTVRLMPAAHVRSWERAEDPR
jgi:hypothetical protein